MIKFRAWEDRGKEYIKDVLIGSDGKIYFDDGVATQDDLDISVEQFTGLKDVNGKDIYEGDIIQYSNQFYEYSMGGVTDRETGYIGSVVKNNGAFGILINRISYTDAHYDHYHVKDFVPFCEFDDPESDVMLKGNAHENPELLEADK
ncbi:YopX family protein [Lactiplantibacillus plantarum]|uniref:YopX family protein n=1 Tax=Lactiplantibacillus plantarum TaxID=1590 RepID=UPI001E34D521|nr:YopX family protein [Lactiplantibacillus plantarum]MCC6117632.1 YopX family protein [Lactiplantibacillus plantarum]MCW6115179.1 YopX family protein [Lactiplantibacillus plantarum]